jgi:hypothetical protein
MHEEQVVKLLTEIRDLQRQHVENYKQALDNQRESIEFNKRWQQKAAQRQFFGLLIVLAVVAALWWVTVVNR